MFDDQERGKESTRQNRTLDALCSHPNHLHALHCHLGSREHYSLSRPAPLHGWTREPNDIRPPPPPSLPPTTSPDGMDEIDSSWVFSCLTLTPLKATTGFPSHRLSSSFAVAPHSVTLISVHVSSTRVRLRLSVSFPALWEKRQGRKLLSRDANRWQVNESLTRHALGPFAAANRPMPQGFPTPVWPFYTRAQPWVRRQRAPIVYAAASCLGGKTFCILVAS